MRADRVSHSPARGVYRGPARTVNPLAPIALAGVMTLVGCTAPPSIAPRIVPVSVRYDVEPVMIGRSPVEARGRIERDFEVIARMGFSEVLASFVAPSERMELLKIAREKQVEKARTEHEEAIPYARELERFGNLMRDDLVTEQEFSLVKAKLLNLKPRMIGF